MDNLETQLKPSSEVVVRGKRTDGTGYEFRVRHTMNARQIEWFKAGSALNLIAAQKRAVH